jgi:hypothetical protein
MPCPANDLGAISPSDVSVRSPRGRSGRLYGDLSYILTGPIPQRRLCGISFSRCALRYAIARIFWTT